MGKTTATRKKYSPEAFYELGEAFGESVKQQSAALGADILSQIGFNTTGTSKNQPEYPASPKEDSPVSVSVFDMANHAKDKKQNAASERYSAPKPKEERRAAIDYMDYARKVLQVGERAERKKENQTSQTVQELKAELTRLAESSKILQMEFTSVSVEQTPTKVGEYHTHFLKWMLYIVRAAREKVEDSGAWLAAVTSKGSKKRMGNKERKNWFRDTSRSMSNEVGGGNLNTG